MINFIGSFICRLTAYLVVALAMMAVVAASLYLARYGVDIAVAALFLGILSVIYGLEFIVDKIREIYQ